MHHQRQERNCFPQYQKEAVDPEDVEILQDMIIGAVNEAIRKVEEIHTTEMEKITNGLSLPGIF